MIEKFFKSADDLLFEAKKDGCRWGQFSPWIYWLVYDLKFQSFKGGQLYAAAAAHASREALKAQHAIMLELRDIITQELLAVDPEYCEKSTEAPWNQPWRWKRAPVCEIAEIVKEYRIIELEEDLD